MKSFLNLQNPDFHNKMMINRRVNDLSIARQNTPPSNRLLLSINQ